MHDWEDYCLRCEISRGYDSNLGDCPSIDCTDTNDAEAVYDLLNAECTKGSSGSCCTTTAQQTAWTKLVTYHDTCAHDEIPTKIEVGFHDYEHSCEAYFCNAVGPDYDGTACIPPDDDDHDDHSPFE